MAAPKRTGTTSDSVTPSSGGSKIKTAADDIADAATESPGMKVVKKPIDQKVTASAKKTMPAEPQVAEQDAGIDTSMCDTAFSKAQICCNHPASCLMGNDQTQYYQLLSASTQTPATNTSMGANGQGQSGMQGTCGQMQAATDSNRQANNLLAATCSEKQTLCDGSCAQLVTKYQTLLQNCNGCESQSIYQSTLTSLTNKRQQCAQFTAQLDNMTGQGAISNNTANSSANCMQTASTGSGQGSSPSNATNNAANSAAAAAAAQAAQATRISLTKGSGGYATASAKKGNFDLGDNADAQAGAAPPLQPSTMGKPATVNPVANSGGGGIPGGSGGGAPTGARGGSGGSAGAPGYTTDIDRGLRGGGGYSAAGGVGGSTDPNGTGGPNAGAGAAPDPKMDLRQYLPGGRRDPAAIGGLTAIQAESLGIHGRFVDIWNRITIRIQAKCISGELYDCR